MGMPGVFPEVKKKIHRLFADAAVPLSYPLLSPGSFYPLLIQEKATGPVPHR
jgi:hypothetical protein